MPPIDSPMAPKPTRSLYGPVCPKPDSRTMINFGLSLLSASKLKFHFSSVPGRKFSTMMSASSASLRTMSCPSFSRRLTVTDFLLRACAYHHRLVPSWSLRHLRNGSPPSPRASAGDSILMTSAPNSASRRPQNGPAISVPISSTFRPSSGIALVAAPCVGIV